MTQTVHAGLTLSCLVAALSSEPLKLPSVPADLPTRKRGFPRLRNLSSFLHRGAGPFPFAFFCPAWLHGDFLILLGV